MKTVGALYSEARLIAKTVNKIILEDDAVDLHPWRIEGKLLTSSQGDCLSSGTLLVKNEHVPTYGIDGRCYGLLFNAEECFVYDVNAIDANTNRVDKLAKRVARKSIDLLSKNDQNILTLEIYLFICMMKMRVNYIISLRQKSSILTQKCIK